MAAASAPPMKATVPIFPPTPSHAPFASDQTSPVTTPAMRTHCAPSRTTGELIPANAPT